MAKKMKLENLKVTSFVTRKEGKDIRGGWTNDRNCTACAQNCSPALA